MNFIVKAAISYLEKHPDVVEQLVEAIVKMALKAATDFHTRTHPPAAIPTV